MNDFILIDSPSVNNNISEESQSDLFDISDFVPEVYDCEADGSCGSGHLHFNT